MLRYHLEIAKREPAQAPKLTMQVKRYNAILGLLKVRPGRARLGAPACCAACDF